jgi:acyl-CoA thioesterase FadM
MLRSGLGKRLEKAGWYPVVAAETMQFRASLRLFEGFDIETRVVGWDEKVFLLEQRFLRREKAVATAWIWARMLRRSGGGVSPREVLALADYRGEDLPLPSWAADWNRERAA